ncbi:uncharacterized protein [Procambarus clarkii]|uniref:uncharacterized protein n=1 Tax=Procambarus clarkii TaxID=6728 RepID=UPI0037439667
METYGRNNEHLHDKFIRSLGIWFDSDSYNILRCGRCLQHAEVDLEVKNPMLLPRHHIISKLIVLHCHEYGTLCGGVLDTLIDLRQKFWLSQGRQTVKSKIKSCAMCQRYDAPLSPYPGPPPRERVVHLHPFKITG